MKKDIKNYKYFFINLFIIIIIFIKLILKKIENFNNIIESPKYKYSTFCINLDRDKVRWDFMKKQFDTLKLNVNRFPAIKIGNKEELKPYSNLLDFKKLRELENIHKNGYRLNHSDLTYGAIGCYLSHTKLWEKLSNSEQDFYLIFEDDSRLPINFNEKFQVILKNLPNDWDIVLLGYIKLMKSKNYSEIFDKMGSFFGLHAYMINKKSYNKIRKILFPINYQIDSLLRFNLNKLKIYKLKNNEFINQAGFKTNIQMDLKERYEIEDENQI